MQEQFSTTLSTWNGFVVQVGWCTPASQIWCSQPNLQQVAQLESTAQYKQHFRFCVSDLQYRFFRRYDSDNQAASVGPRSHINASKRLFTEQRISPFLSESTAGEVLHQICNIMEIGLFLTKSRILRCMLVRFQILNVTTVSTGVSTQEHCVTFVIAL